MVKPVRVAQPVLELAVGWRVQLGRSSGWVESCDCSRRRTRSPYLDDAPLGWGWQSGFGLSACGWHWWLACGVFTLVALVVASGDRSRYCFADRRPPPSAYSDPGLKFLRSNDDAQAAPATASPLKPTATPRQHTKRPDEAGKEVLVSGP